MKLRVLCATLAFGALGMMTMAPVHAQSVDPCTVYTCMAGISGSGASGGPGCTAATDYFFGALVVFDPYFDAPDTDRKSTRLNSSHPSISYAVFCLKKKT